MSWFQRPDWNYSIFFWLIDTLSQEYKVNARNNSLCDRALKQVLSCEADRLGELTVEKVANGLKVSQSYLTRMFRRQRNCPLREYILREKMVRSALLLVSDPDLTVKQLSEKMGYLDYNYFVSIFKSHFGISPGKYRKCKYPGDEFLQK